MTGGCPLTSDSLPLTAILSSHSGRWGLYPGQVQPHWSQWTSTTLQTSSRHHTGPRARCVSQTPYLWCHHWDNKLW